jgi:hypothetical protein
VAGKFRLAAVLYDDEGVNKMLYSLKWSETKLTPVLDEVGQQLMRAADIMEQRSHARNTLVDEQGRVCVQGALQLAHPLHHDVDAILRFNAYTGYRWHTSFNRDHTKEECIAAMRAAAWHK